MERLRVGIVGAGFVARLHADAWRRVAGIDVELAAVAAAHEDRARELAAEHRIERVLPSAEAMFAAADVDVVDLCVPNHLHAPFASAALDARKHVVVEKPLTGCFAPSRRARPGRHARTPRSHKPTPSLPRRSAPTAAAATRRTGCTHRRS